jgi:hypothetical protein
MTAEGKFVVAGTKMMNIDLARARFVGVSATPAFEVGDHRPANSSGEHVQQSNIARRRCNISTLLIAFADM